MAAKKSSRGKAGARSSSRKGGAKKSARGGAKKTSSRKPSARKPSAKRGGAKKSAAKKKSANRRPTARSASPKPRKSPMQRVTSVAKQVAQQAQAAVVGGVEALREMGENIADRVGNQDQQS
jgi:hypothetical protein